VRRILAFWPLGLVPLVVAVVLTASVSSRVDLEITAALQDLSELDSALGAYKVRHGHLPSEADGLAALTGSKGGPLVYIPRDPWGNSYIYHHKAGTNSYLLYSAGLNHRDDAGLCDDVILAPKTYLCADYGLNCPPRQFQVLTWIAAGLAVLSLAVGIRSRFAS